jgi:hypothetical protein
MQSSEMEFNDLSNYVLYYTKLKTKIFGTKYLSVNEREDYRVKWLTDLNRIDYDGLPKLNKFLQTKEI